MARGWLFKIFHLWLFSASLADDNTDENILKKIDHAQSFLESFLAGTADHIFSDRNLFLHSATEDESEDITNEKANSPKIIENDTPDHKDASQLIINDDTHDNSDSGFDYFKVLKENFHNNHHKNDNAGDETSESIEYSDTEKPGESKTYDSDTVTNNDADTVIINDANSVVANDTDIVKTHDTESVVTNEEYSAVTNDKDSIGTDDKDTLHTNVTVKTDSEGTTEFSDVTDEIIDKNVNESNNETKNEFEALKNGEEMSMPENGVDIVDYGPIDRSIKENSYFSDDIFYNAEEAYGPPPLRDQEYFSAHFEVSPSYDLRSAHFLRTLPVHEGAGETTSTQLVFQENRIDRKDKTIFKGVIGGLFGVFVGLAGKKMLLVLLLLGSLAAMGLTGTSPQELYETLTQTFLDTTGLRSLFGEASNRDSRKVINQGTSPPEHYETLTQSFLDATGLSFLFDFKANDITGYETGETSNIDSRMAVSQEMGGSNLMESYYGSAQQMYMFLTRYTEVLFESMNGFASEMGLIWTSFTEGFFNVTGADFFTERDERMMDPLEMEYLKDQFEELQSFQPSDATMTEHRTSDIPKKDYQMNTQEYIFPDVDLIVNNKKNDIERVYYGEQSPAPEDLSMKAILEPYHDQQEPAVNELARNLVYGNDKADIKVQDLIMPNINRIDNIGYPTEALDGGHDGELQDMNKLLFQERTAKSDDSYDHTRFESNAIGAHGVDSSNELYLNEQLFQARTAEADDTNDNTTTESNTGRLDSSVVKRKSHRRLIGPP